MGFNSWGGSRSEPLPPPTRSDADLAAELRSVMQRAAELADELEARGWDVFTCTSTQERDGGKRSGHAKISRKQEL